MADEDKPGQKEPEQRQPQPQQSLAQQNGPQKTDPEQRTGRRHRCQKPGCGKSFSRPSHLERHALNHSDTQWTCARCHASFKRLDLLERHKARHSHKDRLAGGRGKGILKTKRRRGFGVQSPDPSMSIAPTRAYPFEDLPPATPNVPNDGAIPSLPVLAVKYSETPSQSTTDVSPLPLEEGFDHWHELENIYHDPAFDELHFNVSSLSCDPLEDRNFGLAAPQGMSFLEYLEQPVRNREAASISEASYTNGPSPRGPANEVGDIATHGSPASGTSLSSRLLQSFGRMNHVTSPAIAVGPNDPYRLPGNSVAHFGLTSAKWQEIIDYITDIRPILPDGTLVEEFNSDLSMHTMQQHLNSFFKHFNTEYPLIHPGTFKAREAEPMVLLAMLIMGATYGSRESHQLSVCLYDAVIPHILSGLISIPMPDLATLQAFLVLECYGMYRAGPYQRENAILVHALLFNAIRRLSRYHVRAKIALPDSLTHHDEDWATFAYAEQYKRLILFVFMWDTQNVSCFSFMPSMSTQTISVHLPCPKELWEADNEETWKKLVILHGELPKFNDVLQGLMEGNDILQSKTLSALPLTFLLHGLMCMCNDMVHFNNRSIYISDAREDSEHGSRWRLQMMHALDVWKARYDAHSIETVRSTQSGNAQADFEKDTVSLLALYHTAHIIANADVRNLQIAAGAKAVFGHLVTAEDRAESTRLVEQWVQKTPKSAAHAAWHAAQMFREGLLKLQSWDDTEAFHYPWCLYIGTLTCWAFQHFSSEGVICNHTAAQTGERAGGSKASMTNTVSQMASLTLMSDIKRPTECCTHGLAVEVAEYLKTIRWTAAYEATKVLEGLATVKK
ncbi:fungal-specific transcription factor domain-containing protein [Dactylonectria macrodidyma]|uniref:Fungal-specific transcription factor domain-containing protein n=1 Tax=Dactylonectria macrodidyma TaxID=307937 RepID=A0A9P9FN35_9HYPO|nr:fungal-specific transcription factor domain-containing protein [Dactylonectria macrodidyma]